MPKLPFACYMGFVKLTAIYEKAPEGGYTAWAAELPGANTQGETLEEARENLREAISLTLEVNRELRGNDTSPDAEIIREEIEVTFN